MKLKSLFVFVIFIAVFASVSAACTTITHTGNYLSADTTTTLCGGQTINISTTTDNMFVLSGSNITLDCNGSVFVANGTMTNFFVAGGGTRHNIYVYNCTVINYPKGIAVSGNNNTFINVNFTNISGSAGASGMQFNGLNNTVINSNFVDAPISFNTASNSLFSGNNYSGNATFTVTLNAVNITISNNRFIFNGTVEEPLILISNGAVSQNITISNNYFKGTTTSTYLLRGSSDVDLTVRDNTFDTVGVLSPSSAIYLDNSKRAIIINNTFYNMGYRSIATTGINGGTNTTVGSNNITGGYYGIDFYGFQSNISNNIIQNTLSAGIRMSSENNTLIQSNSLINNIGFGLYYYDLVFNSTVINNYIYNNSMGASFEGTHGVTIFNNTIYKNRNTGMAGGSGGMYGIWNISSNNISNNGLQGLNWGAASVESYNLTIQSNQIRNNGETGLYFNTVLSQPLMGNITGNTIQGNKFGIISSNSSYNNNNVVMGNYIDMKSYNSPTQYQYSLGSQINFSTNATSLNLLLPNGTTVTRAVSGGVMNYTTDQNGVYTITGTFSDNKRDIFNSVTFLVGGTYFNRSQIFYTRGGAVSGLGDYGHYPSSLPFYKYGQDSGNGFDTGILSYVPNNLDELTSCSSQVVHLFDNIPISMRAPSVFYNSSNIWINSSSWNTTAYVNTTNYMYFFDVQSPAANTTRGLNNFNLIISGGYSMMDEYTWYSKGFQTDRYKYATEQTTGSLIQNFLDVGKNNMTVNYGALSYNVTYNGSNPMYVYDGDGNYLQTLSSSGVVWLSVEQPYTLVFTGATASTSVSGASAYTYASSNITIPINMTRDYSILLSVPSVNTTTSTGSGGAASSTAYTTYPEGICSELYSAYSTHKDGSYTDQEINSISWNLGLHLGVQLSFSDLRSFLSQYEYNCKDYLAGLNASQGSLTKSNNSSSQNFIDWTATKLYPSNKSVGYVILGVGALLLIVGWRKFA